MSRKDQVMNLFNFMIELLDESTKTTEQETPTAPTKRLKDETLPHHPILNPYVLNSGTVSTIPVQSVTNTINTEVDGNKIKDLFNKMAEIDKRNADELGKLRAVKQATTPLIKELQELKKQGHNNAMEVKEQEELEFLKPEIEQRMGVTIENGKAKIVEVPTTLRDNIPLDEGNQANVGYSVNMNDTTTELKGEDDLPKHIKEKLESSNMPQAIKDTIAQREKQGMEEVNNTLPNAIKEAMMKEKSQNDEIPMPHSGEGTVITDKNNKDENKG